MLFKPTCKLAIFTPCIQSFSERFSPIFCFEQFADAWLDRVQRDGRTPTRLRNYRDALLERASHFWLESPILSRLCYLILRRTYGQIQTTAVEETSLPLPASLMKIYEGNVFTINVEKIRFIISRRYYSRSVPEKKVIERASGRENNEWQKARRWLERSSGLMPPDVWALSSCFTVNSCSLCLSNRVETAARLLKGLFHPSRSGEKQLYLAKPSKLN